MQYGQPQVLVKNITLVLGTWWIVFFLFQIDNEQVRGTQAWFKSFFYNHTPTIYSCFMCGNMRIKKKKNTIKDTSLKKFMKYSMSFNNLHSWEDLVCIQSKESTNTHNQYPELNRGRSNFQSGFCWSSTTIDLLSSYTGPPQDRRCKKNPISRKWSYPPKPIKYTVYHPCSVPSMQRHRHRQADEHQMSQRQVLHGMQKRAQSAHGGTLKLCTVLSGCCRCSLFPLTPIDRCNSIEMRQYWALTRRVWLEVMIYCTGLHQDRPKIRQLIEEEQHAAGGMVGGKQ